jgi:uncharacterized protein (TIGR03435 family)
MNMIRFVALAVFAAAVAFGQSNGSRPEFEVASIKPSPPVAPGGHVDVGLHVDGAQVRCTWFSLTDYIGMAYEVKHYQISGPPWIASERFDIAAKVPSGERAHIRLMLQALLADRFQMKMHREKKELPVYALTVAKGGVKMKEVAEGPEQTPGEANVAAQGGPGGVSVNLGGGSSFSFSPDGLVGKKLAMTGFSDTLARFMDRPVVDLTELKGAYDFTLEITPEDYRAMLIRSAIAAGVQLPPEALRALELSSGDSLISALEKLGLKLEPRKSPVDILVIDSMAKSPTEN